MPFDALGRLQRHSKRTGEVVRVLAKYGLAGGLRWLDVDWIQDHLRSVDGERLREQSLEARIRMALSELGTTFIKLGQVLSTRADVVGTALANELAVLQSRTHPDPPEVVRATLLRELQRPPEELFAHFEATAFASASIAQVHRAVLPTGETIVLKIQRDGVRQEVETDLEILQALARLAERHAAFLRPYQPMLLARQFRRTLLRELDFAHERRHLEQFAQAFADDDSVHFPAVHPNWSTTRVLAMEYLVGVPAADPAALRATGVPLADFARAGANVWLEMIFRDGRYHADPHPGNLLLLPGGIVGVLDCGMVGRIDEGLRQDIEDLLFAAAERDVREVADIVLRIGAAPGDTDRTALQGDLAELLDDYLDQSLRDLDVGRALGDLLDVVRRYHIVLPSQLSLLLRTLIVLDGTSRALDRDFSLAELIEPIYRRALRRRLGPRQLWRRVRTAGREWRRLLDVLPGDLRTVLGRMREGTLQVHLDHQNLDASVDRLVLGIVVAALLLGAASLWSSKAPPLVAGVPVLGLLSYLLAGWFGLRLWRAARHARERARGPN